MVRVRVRIRVSVRVRVRFRVMVRVRVRFRVRVRVKIRARARVKVGETVNMVSRTGRNENGYGKILIANMVSRTGRHKKRVREDIAIEYDFPYWKKLNTGTGSRTGRNEKTGTGRQ